MIETVNLTILIGAGLILASAFTSLISQRIGAPLLLVFLGVGLLAGENGVLGIEFDDGGIAYFIGSLSLAIILFDSGFETRWQSYRLAAAPALVLATIGVVLTSALVGAAAFMLLDLGWIESLMLGAIIASTDAAAVFFLLRVGGINLREKVRATLELESSTNDPMAIFLTLALVDLAAATQDAASPGWRLVVVFVQQIGLGLVFGALGGLGIAWLLNRLRGLDPGLFPIAALSCALLVFAGTGAFGGSGFLAAYVAGLVAGNSGVRHVARIRRFNVGMTWLAQIGMFLTLGLLATPAEFGSVAGPAIMLGFILIFIARPLAVWLCLLPFGFRPKEVVFIGWVGLRGAVSILLAILPTIGGVPDGQLFFNVVFVMVLASLLIQGWTIAPAARRLGILVPSRVGPVDRIELELPGGVEQELVGYRVHPESPVGRGERVPRWARPLLIVRGDRSYTIHNAGHLMPSDQVYLFATPRQIPQMDRIYGAPASIEGRNDLGDFVLSPNARVGDIAQIFGAEVSVADADLSLGDLLRRDLPMEAEVGDRHSLGPVDLVVRAVDADGRVSEVGLALEPVSMHALGRFQRGMAGKLRDWFRRPA